MPAERVLLWAEFSYQPRAAAAIDALYLAHPEMRGKITTLLGISVAGMVFGLGAAVIGGHLFAWAACLVLGSLALVVLGWWALTQSFGSVFAGPGTVYVDDNGLLVRPAHGNPLGRSAHGGPLGRPAYDGPLVRPAHTAPTLLPWSSLRGWGETDKVIVLFPNIRSGRPLHVIPASAVESSGAAPVFRELLRWHLGKPKS